VARAKPAVPARAWPALLAVRSLVGERPLVGLPGFRSVLVVAPHPDDESVGAGGTIRLLADAGASVTILFATSGEATIGAPDDPEEVSSRRRSEALAACRLLGATPRFLDHPDGGLSGATDLLAREMGAAAGELRPEAVFLPWFADGHPDHEACTIALSQAGIDPKVEVWGFETWTPLPANRLVDITPAIGAKRAAVAAHSTAHLAFDLGALIGLSRYRSVHGLMGQGYAEAFLAAPVPQYLKLATDARTSAQERSGPADAGPQTSL
jgi:N-acetylglucosamine malate deacetylase 1